MHKNKILHYGFLLVTFFTFSNRAICQPDMVSPQTDVMKSYMKQYQDYTNTNKNALALEVLQRYAIQQEVVLNRERDSVAKALQNEFIQSQKKRSEEISAKENQIIELKSGNEDIDRENIKMTRNTLLFFGILIGIAVLVLLNRFRSLAAIKEQYELSNSNVRYAEKFSDDPQKDRSEASKLGQSFQNAQRLIDEASVYLNNIVSDKQNPLNKPTALLLSNSKKSNSLLHPEPVAEAGTKQSTDLNQLIDEVTDQAYFYFGSEAPEFNCDVVRDLEKILPKIEIVSEEIRLVVFNLLMNAFDSVNEKRKNAPKGYLPKVTISTRKLPRFVQIRIKDNGTGIREKEPKQLMEPFYTTKKSEKHPGLGLSESARIINTVHKGELIIESDPGSGSDFIIRFTTLTLM